MIPRGAVARALKEIEPDWTIRVDKYMASEAGCYGRVHASVEKYPDHVHYSVRGYQAMGAALRKHLDRDCMDDADLEHAFVTSCQLESFFAVIDDVSRASNHVDITQNRGVERRPLFCVCVWGGGVFNSIIFCRVHSRGGMLPKL